MQIDEYSVISNLETFRKNKQIYILKRLDIEIRKGLFDKNKNKYEFTIKISDNFEEKFKNYIDNLLIIYTRIELSELRKDILEVLRINELKWLFSRYLNRNSKVNALIEVKDDDEIKDKNIIMDKLFNLINEVFNHCKKSYKKCILY